MAPLKLYLGGTFNPVHIGHTRLALECHLRTGAEVMFVPSGDPPHKTKPHVALDHRIAMLNLAVEELNLYVMEIAQEADVQSTKPVFGVELWETEVPGPSYTLHTLRELRRRDPYAVLVWIIGMDSLVNLHQWHRWQELTDSANLLVINRPGWNRPRTGAVANWLSLRELPLEQLSASGGVAFLQTTALPLASSDIRWQLADGAPGKYLVPDPVCRYIHQHHLYLSTNY